MSKFFSYFAPVCFLSVLGLASSLWAQSPRLSVRQFGVQFICTADGQPDMYSWRLPIKDTGDQAESSHYRIPEFNDAELEEATLASLPMVSGGRTALLLDPNVIGSRVVVGENPVGFSGGDARLTNLNAISWAAENGQMKRRAYSNYPPLLNPSVAGYYGTVANPASSGSANYGRYYLRHPGYDSNNWNWTLDYNAPLQVEQKRIQAHLYVEFYMPPSSPDEDFTFTLVIPASDLASILVNDRAVFSRNQDLHLTFAKKNFSVAQDGKVGGFVSLNRLLKGRRSQGVGTFPEDMGYTRLDLSSISYELGSKFFTTTRAEDLHFSSEVINLRIYEGASVFGQTPLQTVQVRLPAGTAPMPDLVTVGTYQVQTHTEYPRPSGAKMHPAINAQSWWGMNRAGAIGDLLQDNFWGKRLGRFRFTVSSITEDVLTAFNPINQEQRVPGFYSIIYGHEPVFYPDVKQVSVAHADANSRLKAQYAGPDYNLPLHFGSDSLRVVENVDPDTPKSHVAADQFVAQTNYNNREVYLQPGFMDDQPLITSQPTPVRDEEAKVIRMTVGVTARGTVSYQWRLQGQPIPGATTASYELSTVNPVGAGMYDVIVYNSKAKAISESVEISIINPKIIEHPATTEVVIGGNVTLRVVAGGTELTYQWQRNGVGINGATKASLTLNKVTETDEGIYTVVITGKYGTVIAAPATITVKPNLAIVQAPVGGTVRVGGRLSLSVIAVGVGPLQYQWRRDRSPVEGAISSQLMLTPTAGDDLAGSYDVVVSNVQGSLTSPAAKVVTVAARPIILTQPEDQTVSLGGEARFVVWADAEGYAYQWRLNGVNIKGATSSIYKVTGVKKSHEGRYDCVVSKGPLSTISSAAKLEIPAQLSFTNLPLNQIIVKGSDVNFFAFAEAEGGIPTYQWLLNGRPLVGANFPTLALKKVSVNQAGTYSVIASVGKVKVTATAQLQVLDPSVAVYKVTGTGKSQVGSQNLRVAVTGYLLVQCGVSSPSGTLILSSKDGRLQKYQTHPLSNLRVDTVGVAAKAELVISDVYDSNVTPAERSILWLQGMESVIKLSAMESLLMPKTLSGHANQLRLTHQESGEVMTLSKINLRAVLDTPHTLRSRQSSESLEDSLERVTLEMSLRGQVEAP